MLTFEGIRHVYEEEKRNPGILSRLPDKFFEELKEYIGNKKKALKSEEDKSELENVKIRLSSIFDMRERKIINSALDFVRDGPEPANMLKEEKELFDAVVSSIKAYRNAMSSVLDFSGKSEISDERENKKTENAESEDDLIPVDFKEDIAEFVGIDMKTYGPLKRGDIASIPRANAVVLQNLGKGDIIKYRF